MKTSDYNVEFAHMYADELFGKEQKQGTSIARDRIKQLIESSQSVTSCVLIDDLHPVVANLQPELLIKTIRDQGIDLDYLGFESHFDTVVSALIQELPAAMLEIQYFDHKTKEVLFLKDEVRTISLKEQFPFMNRYTCAILSAAWSLCRLGAFEAPASSVVQLSKKPFIAKKLLTVLPEKYRVVEDKVRDIILATRFTKMVEAMEYHYF